MNRLLCFFLFPLTIVAQEFITSSSFESKVAKGVTVIEFWAEWNESNEVPYLSQLKGCEVYKVCIADNVDIKNDFNVVVIPTIIILDNGIEQVRFNPNIMMRISVKKKDVQSAIDAIALSKFQ